MIKRTLYLTWLFTIQAVIPSYAQSPPDLSLARAWELGFKNYPAFAENQAQLKAADFQARLVKNSYLPQLQVQLQNTYGTYAGSTGAFFPLPGIFNISGNSTTGKNTSATTNLYGSMLLDWKVYDFDRRAKSLQAARFQAEVAKSQFSASQLAVQARISRMYMDILYNQANERWASANVNRLHELSILSQSLSMAGLKPGADTLFVLSAYRQAVAEKKNWEGKARASKIQMMELIAEPTDYITIPEKGYLSTPTTDWQLLWSTEKADSSTHPYLQVLQQHVHVDRVQRELANLGKYPSLSVMGGISGRGSGVSVNDTRNTYTDERYGMANNFLIGVGITWNLNKAYNTRLESNLAEQALLTSVSRYDVQALKLTTTLKALAAQIQVQKEQIDEARQAIQHARQAYDQYVFRYKNGLINLTELLQLQLLLQQAEKSAIEASHQYWVQVTQLAEVSGDFSYLSSQF